MSSMWQAFPEQRHSRLLNLPTELIEKIMDHVYEPDQSLPQRTILPLRQSKPSTVLTPGDTEKQVITLGFPMTVRPMNGEKQFSSKLGDVSTAVSLWAGASDTRSDLEDVDAHYRKFGSRYGYAGRCALLVCTLTLPTHPLSKALSWWM